ncbi:MAG: hypothetical protein ABEH43_05250, partial [Flavobacteriales bacterium]
MKELKIITLAIFLFVLFSNAYAQFGKKDPRIKVTYEVKKLEGELNTEGIEYSPFLMNNSTLYFTSDREHNLVNYGMSDWEDFGYHSIFRAKIEPRYDTFNIKSIERISNKVNIEDHTGPVSFSAGDSMAVFSRSNDKVTKV